MSTKLTRSLPRLFGHEARNRVLVSLALNGPVPKRRLAESLDTGYSVIYAVLQHYHDLGVADNIAEHGRSVGLTSWFAAPALEALLYKLAGTRRQVRIKSSSRSPHRISELFGGRNRTRILMLLASVGATPAPIVARLAGLTNASAHNAISHLVREHIVQTEGTLTSLDPSFRAAKELRRLLERMAAQLLNLGRVHSTRERLLNARTRKPRRVFQAPTRQSLPFGNQRQGRLLLEIARRDIATVSELAKALDWSGAQVSAVAQSLERHYLLASMTTGSSRNRTRWLALNPRHPLRPPLQLFASSERAGSKRLRPRVNGQFPVNAPLYRPGEIPACLPGDEVPNNLLIALTRRGGLSTDRQLAQDVGQSRGYIMTSLLQLERQQLIRLHKKIDGFVIDVNPVERSQTWTLLRAASEFLERYGGNGQHRCNPKYLLAESSD